MSGSGLLRSLRMVIPKRSLTMRTMTRECESTAATVSLLLAFELGQRSWKLGFSAGMGQRPRIRQIAAGAIGVIEKEILQAKMRLGLSLEAPVISCYEAG